MELLREKLLSIERKLLIPNILPFILNLARNGSGSYGAEGVECNTGVSGVHMGVHHRGKLRMEKLGLANKGCTNAQTHFYIQTITFRKR